MTTSQVSTADTPADAPIAEYLRQQPDFFVRNEALLASLRLPHPHSGATVSLVERQVDVLREKSQSLEARLTEFMQVARANDVLVGRIHRFTRRLLAAEGRQNVISQIELSLREDFELPNAVLVVFGLGALDLTANRFLSLVERKDPGLAQFDSLFASGKPRCGPLRDAQREFLFGADSGGIASAALVPLGGKDAFGLLAIGSHDRDHFNPAMSTEFLARMGDLAGDALSQG